MTDLSGRLDAFEEAEEDDDPGQGQAAQEGESHLSQVPDVVGDVQNVVPWRNRRLEWFDWQQTPIPPPKKQKQKYKTFTVRLQTVQAALHVTHTPRKPDSQGLPSF